MNGIDKSEDGRFMQGYSGNPAGRPRGAVTGRSKMLGALDRMLGEEKSLAILEQALRATLRKRPVWFFMNIVMPLMPKEAKGCLDAGGRVFEWHSLLSVCEDAKSADGDSQKPGTAG
ncbi:MAG: DUF5681 domain-containing protein [bacterium]